MLNLSSHITSREQLLMTLAKAVLTFAIVASFAFMLHKFFRFIGSAPYVSTDDALANVSVTLSNLGRYGNLASPLQANTNVLRSDGFFNYGPWPFYIGAVLDWLFGSSYAVQRTVHPLGLILIVILGAITFRRTTLLAIGLLAWGLLFEFWRNHWPMFRPDIVVPMFAAGAFVSFWIGERRGHWLGWLLGGFCAASMATTHQIAWIAVPWTLVIWVAARCYAYREAGGKTSFLKGGLPSFIALGAGGILGAGVYLHAIDFRLGDLFDLWASYASWAQSKGGRTFTDLVSVHYSAAWGGTNGWVMAVLWASFILAVGLLTVSLVWPQRTGREVWALLLAPTALAVFYPVSLGFYNNFHSGYLLLTHVATFWTAAAAWAALGITLRQTSFSVPGPVHAVAMVGFAAFIFWNVVLNPGMTSRWEDVAKKSVPYEEYEQRLLGPLPDGASIWGDVRFGLESGTRVGLLQYTEGRLLASNFKPRARNAVAPNFLALNYIMPAMMRRVLMDGATAPGDRRRLVTIQDIVNFFPGFQYRPRYFVHAPPYKTTHVFQAVNASQADEGDVPRVFVNDGQSRQWKSNLGKPFYPEFRPAAPVTIKMQFRPPTIGNADTTKVGTLDPGAYLLEIDLALSGSPDIGMIATSSTPTVIQYLGNVPSSLDYAIYFPYNKKTYVLVPNHPGGSLYVSQFHNHSNASFSVSSVWSVTGFDAPTTYVEQIDVPETSNWNVMAKHGQGTLREDGTYYVIGDDSSHGYQATLGPVEVPKKVQVSVDLDIELISGRIAVGVESIKSRKWILEPTPNWKDISFGTTDDTDISLVIGNLNASTKGERSEFVIRSLRMTYPERMDSIIVDAMQVPRVPPPSTWIHTTPEAKIELISESGAVRVFGDTVALGYQINSPEIDVPKGTDMEFSTSLVSENGKAGLGIMVSDNGTNRWLVSPRRETRNIRFNTQKWDKIRIFVTGLDEVDLDKPRQFRLEPGYLRFTNRVGYVDILSLCHRSVVDGRNPICLDLGSPK